MAQIKIKRGSGVPAGLTHGELAYDATNKRLYIGITGASALLANTDGGVSSFNGLTGAVTGVPSYNGGYGGVSVVYSTGLTSSNVAMEDGSVTYTVTNTGVLSVSGISGSIGLTSGSGIRITSSGSTFTVTNIGVTSFNGLTGAVTGVTTGTTNTFQALQSFAAGISASGGGTLTSGTYNFSNLKLNTVGGDEGGQIDFGPAITNTSLTGGVSIDVYQNRVRIFESGGTNRGAYIDLTAAATGVGTNLLSGSGGGATAAGVTGSIQYKTGTGGFSGSSNLVFSSSGFTASSNSFYVSAPYVTLDSSGGQVIINSPTEIDIGDITGNGNNTYVTINDAQMRMSMNSFMDLYAVPNIYFTNGEYIRNSTNGRFDIMPAPSGSTHYGIYFDTTSWGFGVVMGTVRSSDGAINTGGNFRFDVPLTISADTRFQLGSDGHYGFYRTDTGNNTGQMYAYSNNANNSGAIALVSYFAVGNANRSPATSHTNPNFYIYAEGVTSANDFIRFEHDRTNGNIVSGGTTGILIQPGSGQLGVSGGICGGAYILNSNGILTLTGATYTFLASDNGEVIVHNRGSGATFTVPSGLPVGFSCTIIHIGTGGLGFTSASGVTLNSWTNKYSSVGQHATIGLISYATNTFNLSGGLT